MNIEREIALQALLEFRKSGAWPDLYLKNKLNDVSRAQAALATNITYGVLQKQSLLDYYISCFSSVKLPKITPIVLDAMRMAVYQILFLDKIPDSAAVNEAVDLIKKHGQSKASGFANGVLRTIVRQKDNLPEVKGKTFTETLAIRYSHPVWLVRRLIKMLGGDEAEALLRANNEPVRPVIRVNTLKTTSAAFADAAKGLTGNSLEAVEGLSDGYYADDLAELLKSDLFADGHFYVQDAASQYAVHTLAPQPGDRVLDICAAPGGKSILAAQLMEDKGTLISNDLYEHKAALIRANAEKYGIHILQESCKDSCLYNPDFEQSFDKIICDVPCSGLGIIRKKPDIRFKEEGPLADLLPIQKKILDNAASYLKPGGTMIYTTCTILPEENERMLKNFLKTHEDFHLCSFDIRGEKIDGYITLYPHRHGTDGFFISKLERRA